MGAFGTLVKNLEPCYETLGWKVGIKHGKYGPMGEDLFAQKCMDKMGVAKKEAFHLTMDGACEADRPEGEKKNKKFIPTWTGVTGASVHPFKKPEKYFECMDEAAPAFRSLYNVVVVKPKYEACAKSSENCLEPRCCAVAGINCYKINATFGKCMKSCAPGGTNGTCEGVAPHTEPVVEDPGLSLFCFSVYTQNHGSTKVSHELELLKEQKRKGVSIFSCAGWAVYSDVAVPLDESHSTIQVHDVKDDFHFAKRKTTGSWVNTGMFVQVWTAINAAGEWANFNWVIKVDADAVFFPQKLTNMLQAIDVPAEGLYLENCKYVDYGYFGNLEVFSKNAFGTLIKNLETCYTTLPWKVGIKHGKYGPMGEDLFAQKCMDKMGVAKKEAFYLTTDGACEADRPEGEKKNKKFIPTCTGVTSAAVHPFKKPDKYFECMDEAAPAFA